MPKITFTTFNNPQFRIQPVSHKVYLQKFIVPLYSNIWKHENSSQGENSGFGSIGLMLIQLELEGFLGLHKLLILEPLPLSIRGFRKWSPSTIHLFIVIDIIGYWNLCRICVSCSEADCLIQNLISVHKSGLSRRLKLFCH